MIQEISKKETPSRFPEHHWTGEELRELFPQASDLAGILTGVQSRVEELGEVVCEFAINGITLTEVEEQRFAGVEVGEIHSLRVRSQKPLQLLDDSIESCSEYIGKILVTLEKASALFRSGDVHGAHECHRRCIEGAEAFVEMITYYKIAYQSLKGGLPATWSGLEREMLRTLTLVYDEYVKKNYILVADLLEYDLSNIFATWKRELASLERHVPTDLKKSQSSVC